MAGFSRLRPELAREGWKPWVSGRALLFGSEICRRIAEGNGADFRPRFRWRVALKEGGYEPFPVEDVLPPLEGAAPWLEED